MNSEKRVDGSEEEHDGEDDGEDAEVAADHPKHEHRHEHRASLSLHERPCFVLHHLC